MNLWAGSIAFARARFEFLGNRWRGFPRVAWPRPGVGLWAQPLGVGREQLDALVQVSALGRDHAGVDPPFVGADRNLVRREGEGRTVRTRHAELADEMGLRGGERVKVSSARGHYIAKAMVTRRIKPMQIDGRKTYQIGIPIHWGYRGIAEDEGKTALTPANMLSPAVIDPNAYTPEFKGFLVKLEKV